MDKAEKNDFEEAFGEEKKVFEVAFEKKYSEVLEKHLDNGMVHGKDEATFRDMYRKEYIETLKKVRADGLELVYVWDEFVDEVICLEAVKQNWEALAHVPEQFKTLEMCEIALKQNEEAVDFVPAKIRNAIRDTRTYNIVTARGSLHSNKGQSLPPEIAGQSVVYEHGVPHTIKSKVLEYLAGSRKRRRNTRRQRNTRRRKR